MKLSTIMNKVYPFYLKSPDTARENSTQNPNDEQQYKERERLVIISKCVNYKVLEVVILDRRTPI